VTRSLGKYQLVRRLAVGGMAEVYLASHAGPGGFRKDVAIKRILPVFADNRDFVAMFLDEARLVARFNHPNLVHIFDFGQVDDAYFVAMEYVHGATLAKLLEVCRDRGKTFPYAIAARVMNDVCGALQYAHTFTEADGTPLDLVHRDVNPQNIMVTYDGVVKVLDFGVAKAATNLVRTAGSTVKGKLAYASPEQITQEVPVDRRSDIFSLGITLFQLTTGKLPFSGVSSTELMAAVVQHPTPDPRETHAMPDQLAMTIMTCLAKSPRQRHQSARALGSELEEFLKAQSMPTDNYALAAFVRDLVPPSTGEVGITVPRSTERLPPEDKPPARWRWPVAALSLLGLVAVIVLGLGGAPKAIPPAPNPFPVAAALPKPGAPTPNAPLPNAPTSSAPVAEPSPPAVAAPAPQLAKHRPQKRTAPPVAGKGHLQVFVQPFGEVFVDGESHGLTPLDEPLELGEGKHTILVRCSRTGKEEKRVVQVKADETRRLYLDLR
jgi:serine/threonine protein kinase